MPFGKKPSPTGPIVDFDQIYANLIAPAITAADLEPLRADHEVTGGIIHEAMFERLILCPFAIADLTLANANVYYELGIRHAFRPWSTVPIMADDSRLLFDVQMLRTVQYKLDASGVPDAARVDATVATVAKLLQEARNGKKDSPLFQLVDGLEPPSVAHAKTDCFREQVDYSNEQKEKLAAARKQSREAVKEIEGKLGNIADVEAGVVIDLFLSYRARSAWQDMIDLVPKMSPPLQETVMVREQLGLALNRLKRRDEAEAVLTKLIDQRGPSSETFGILGRVYKDHWDDAQQSGDLSADAYLDKAIETYLKGFESDWRDAYPGVNALTLMEIKDPPDERRTKLLAPVRYAVERKIAAGRPDYWDWATLLEISVLANEPGDAKRALSNALTCLRESWEAASTTRNLGLIRQARERRGAVPPWQAEIEAALQKRAGMGNSVPATSQ